LKEVKVTLQLENIYGGDGFERPDTVKEVKLERTDKTVTVRKDVGVPVEKEKEEKRVEEKEISVKTFKRDEDGTPLYRLGGTHGKLWGAMREAGYNMYQAGQQENKVTTDRVLKALRIDPQWVPLKMDDDVEMEMDELPQMLSGKRDAMIQQYFDVIPECKAEVVLKFPEEFEDLIMEYLDRTQTMNFGNKRRGTITILEKEELS